jgi:hypothetical protein
LSDLDSKMVLEMYEIGVKPGMNFSCPKCHSKNVVIECTDGGYCSFYKCNECSYVRSKEDSKNK